MLSKCIKMNVYLEYIKLLLSKSIYIVFMAKSIPLTYKTYGNAKKTSKNMTNYW